jgi:carbon-monoxide dehydrogenase large subunit
VSQQILTKPKSTEAEEIQRIIGKPLKRKEDPRLLAGSGKYVDDLKLPGMLFSAVLRSTYAHAFVKKIDISSASQAPGVKLVLTGSDLKKMIVNPLAKGIMPDGSIVERPVLADNEVRYLGEPLAFVVAESRYEAEDALELIPVDYEQLGAAIDPKAALMEDSPKVHHSLKSNLALVEEVSFGDVDSAFKKAAKVVKGEFLNQRLSPVPIETRACVASYENGSLTLWISTQGPFQVRSDICDVLKIPENKTRIIAPEVGGGFGAKLSLYSEEVLCSLSSMRLGRPVKWVETRSENFLSMTQGRGQNQFVEIASNERGRILGVKVKLIGDAGAYLTEGSSDSTFTLKMVPGCYMIPAYHGEARVVLTNKVPHDAYRGASRPEAIYLIERAMDELARELGIDPIELRLRNFIPKENFPFKTAGDLDYDTGDYEMNLRKALEFAGYADWIEEQKKARQNGRLVGIGVSTYVEICAFGPEFPQTAAVTVTRSGKVLVSSGTSPHGQGHETPLSQIVSEQFGIPLEDIEVIYGDTSQLPWGTFTAGSRSGALGGSAVLMSVEKIKSKMTGIASAKLEVPEADIKFRNGELVSSKDPSKKISFQRVAYNAYDPKKIPEGMEPVLFAFSAFTPKSNTFPFGTHIAVVEVQKETGEIKILEYTAVDDCGKVLNPLVVEGQIHGGITQGLGQALLEGVHYDPDGQLLTASFLDYQIPQAGDVPQYRCFRTETPTFANALGIKGVGEAGTIASTPTLANAVADALSPLGIELRDMPLTPDYVRRLIKDKS